LRSKLQQLFDDVGASSNAEYCRNEISVLSKDIESISFGLEKTKSEQSIVQINILI
jgi:hypothetical protein